MAEQLEPLDLWWCEVELPNDARAHYKLLVDGEWMLDPSNPVRSSAAGEGPSSVLRMRDHVGSDGAQER